MEPTCRKILVTGSSGFVGGYLVRELQSAGYEVFGVDRVPPRESIASLMKAHCELDLGDRAAVLQLLEDFRPDGIMHLAGWAHVGESWKHPYPAFDANVINTITLYQAASEVLQKECRFLYVSSAEVHGNIPEEELPITESSPLNPVSPYGVSKLVAENALRTLRQSQGMPVMVARPFNHVGPGQAPTFALPSFARRIVGIERGDIDVFRHGNLEVYRDFLDVRDVVRAYRLMYEKGMDGDTFLIASGESHSIASIAEMLFRLAGVEAKMERDPALYRQVEMRDNRGDSSFLRDRTGWRPEIPFEQTLADILEDARARYQPA